MQNSSVCLEWTEQRRMKVVDFEVEVDVLAEEIRNKWRALKILYKIRKYS